MSNTETETVLFELKYSNKEQQAFDKNPFSSDLEEFRAKHVYFALFGAKDFCPTSSQLMEAAEFEEYLINMGDQFLPECVLEAKGDKDPTSGYWDFMVDQFEDMYHMWNTPAWEEYL